MFRFLIGAFCQLFILLILITLPGLDLHSRISLNLITPFIIYALLYLPQDEDIEPPHSVPDSHRCDNCSRLRD